MKILLLGVYKHCGSNSNPHRLAFTTDVSSFSYFTRSSIVEHLQFGGRTITQRTNPGFRQSVSMKDNPFLVHCYTKSNGLSGIVIADREYPQRVAFGLINQILLEYEEECKDRWVDADRDIDAQPDFLAAAIQKYQNPKEADKIMKIQRNLDDIKDIMVKNIDQVLANGTQLDVLMEKSEDLSMTSKTFYKQAKKNNQCCKMY